MRLLLLLFIPLSALAQSGLTVNDLNVQRDYWIEKAASGDSEAQFVVGDSYLHGRINLPKDAGQAAAWFEKAAQQGSVEAQFELGKLYYFGGPGFSADGERAVHWLTKAQEKLKPKGRTFAQVLIATCYTTGLGMPKNDGEAAKWFRWAAEGGNQLAAYRLGLCYAEGSGVPQDEKQAVLWFTRAAQGGELEALTRLGQAYTHGRGVPQDFVAAYKWYNLAASKGNPQAQHSREMLRSLMTPAQVAEAQRQSSEFYSGNFRFSDVGLKQ